MDTDIRDEIERSFGDGPPLLGHDDLLLRARASLRRRRLAEAGATLAVTLVAVTGATLLGSGDDQASPGPAGTPGTHAPARPDPTPPASAEPEGWAAGTPIIEDASLRMDDPVDALPDGLHVAPQLQVVEVLDDPWRLGGTGSWSAALSYRGPDGPQWWVGYVEPDGSGAATTTPAAAAADGFSAWAASKKVELYNPTGTPGGQGHDSAGDWPGITELDLVRFAGGTERLAPVDGVALLRQRAHPDLPRSWGAPHDRSAVAEVELDGTRYYVLARALGDAAPQYIAVKAAQGGATLEDFLDFARDHYAEGGGGLL